MNLCLGNFEREVWLGWQVGKNVCFHSRCNDFSDPLILSLDVTVNTQKFPRSDTHQPRSNYQSKQMHSALFWKMVQRKSFLEAWKTSEFPPMNVSTNSVVIPHSPVLKSIWKLIYCDRVRVITGFLCATSQSCSSVIAQFFDTMIVVSSDKMYMWLEWPVKTLVLESLLSHVEFRLYAFVLTRTFY